ncbi:DEAD/DEAH box helicase [Humibacter ginsenosidimutans]|uniref:DEAD/DEAH box helicase n=1 Tax=Humibacter ginsenosidimutans TaxID=2599293 RepID=A0A5B8M4D9_9MICO|nr:DEAD/DEAH box helicase [Humibacter ginsenosidimutans]QDZ15193.1 DEAD/DEAH box helicase [Humibacter ginsenosidimutans]
MPKNQKPAGRPNFDPYAKKSNGQKTYGAKSGSKPGSRSAGHRGYRPEDADAPKKRRWTSDERAARGHAAERPRGTRDDARGDARRDARGERDYSRTERGNGGYRGQRDERPARDDRPRYDRNGRDDRRSYGGERRSYDDRQGRNDRGGRRYDDQRGARRYDDDRPRRRFDDDARPARRFDNDARPARRFDNDERPARRYDDDRPRRRFDDGDRQPRRFDDRPARRFDNDDRPARRFDGDRAPRREDDRPRRSFDDRPRRSFNDDRPRRSFDDRPARRFDGERGDRRSDAPRERRESDFYPKRDEQHSFSPADDVVLERLQAEAIEASDVDGVSFGDLGLGGNIVRALSELGAEAPFPIQAATIPEVLAGRDVLGRGRTGSGKTIAFGAPLVERLMQLWAESGRANGKRTMGRAPRALIMAPTRELALQIDRTVQPIARSVGLFTTQIYGGVPQARQVGALRRGVDIVIGTPGRIEDLIAQGHLDLSEVAITVLDEADHMCDLGFLEPVQRILRQTSEGGQKLLFSATLDSGVANLVDEFLVEPAVHEVAGEDQASGTIDHRVFVIEHREKGQIVEQLADRDGKTLVFARTRAFAEQLADQLDDAGIPAVSLHGDLSQSRRQRNLDKLSNGRVSVLVATDVAARGIHVDDIDLVIQADAPDEYKTYLHRSGRTGRAGKQGTVVTLIPRQRRRRMTELLGRAEIQAEFEEVAAGDARISDLVVAAD